MITTGVKISAKVLWVMYTRGAARMAREAKRAADNTYLAEGDELRVIYKIVIRFGRKKVLWAEIPMVRLAFEEVAT